MNKDKLIEHLTSRNLSTDGGVADLKLRLLREVEAETGPNIQEPIAQEENSSTVQTGSNRSGTSVLQGFVKTVGSAVGRNLHQTPSKPQTADGLSDSAPVIGSAGATEDNDDFESDLRVIELKKVIREKEREMADARALVEAVLNRRESGLNGLAGIKSS